MWTRVERIIDALYIAVPICCMAFLSTNIFLKVLAGLGVFLIAIYAFYMRGLYENAVIVKTKKKQDKDTELAKIKAVAKESRFLEWSTVPDIIQELSRRPNLKFFMIFPTTDNYGSGEIRTFSSGLHKDQLLQVIDITKQVLENSEGHE